MTVKGKMSIFFLSATNLSENDKSKVSYKSTQMHRWKMNIIDNKVHCYLNLIWIKSVTEMGIVLDCKVNKLANKEIVSILYF